MKFLNLLSAFFLVLMVAPITAQEQVTNTVRFNGFSFSFDTALGANVNIVQVSGDPVEGAVPGFSDAAKTQFILYHPSQIADSFFDTGGVLVYRMQDLAQYEFLRIEVERLQTLLDEHPDPTQFSEGSFAPADGLPYIPTLTHGQTLIARARYVETPAVTGISYLTQVSAAIEPLGGSRFLYTFQGISTNDEFYVNITIMLETELFPVQEEIAPVAFQENWSTYLAESITLLNEAEPSDFAPSLDLPDAIIQSFSLRSN